METSGGILFGYNLRDLGASKWLKWEAMYILTEFCFKQPACPSLSLSLQQLFCSPYTATMFVLSKAAGTNQCLTLFG